MKKIFQYLVKYMIPGVATFAIDLILLWIFLEEFYMHYIPAAIIAFTIGTSINYVAARKWVFLHTRRGYEQGYIFFMILAVLGVMLTVASMAVLVEIFEIDPVPARVTTAAIVGIWNFLMNYYLNFKTHRHG